MKENKSKFVNKYIKSMTSVIQKMHPEWDDDLIEETILDMLKKQMVNPSVELDNNYTGENKSTRLLSVFDWVLDRKPIIAGNGTFYRNQHEAINPVAKMLNDMAARRKAFKKQMFAIEDTESHEYKDLDRNQANEKINMNSYYGASGAPSSAFFSKWSGPATTLSAQSVISTTETLFEAYLGDNYLFIDTEEMFQWIEVILHDMEKEHLDSFVKIHTKEELTERLLSKIIRKNDMDESLINLYLESLNDEQITFLYYKNNMIQFIDEHENIKEYFIKILENVVNLDYVDKDDKDWINKIPVEYVPDFANKKSASWNSFVNKKYFMDPNDTPSEIKKYVEELNHFLMKYVYARYLSFDRIYRLRNFKRKVVTVIDTDSNILSLDTLMNYILDNIVKGESFDRGYLFNIFILVNTITYSITSAVQDILYKYGEFSNIPEEFRGDYVMKNEFFFIKLIIGESKKRYMSKILLREGNLMNPPKIDIKGFDFKKATCSEYAEKVFMKIIKKRIIEPDEIDVIGIQNDIFKFQDEIKNSIRSGDKTFLTNGNVKDVSAYKNPGAIQSVRGSLAWNYLYPDNKIEAPTKVSLLKMNIFCEEDIEKLKSTHRDIYDVIIDKIFNDTSGIFVTSKKEIDKIDYVSPTDKDWINNIPKKYRTKYRKLTPVEWNRFVDSYDKAQPEKDYHFEYSYKGMQVLAIPSNAKIPDWAIEYADINTMVNDIVSPFKPVLKLFGSKFQTVGKIRNGVDRKSEQISNIIKF